MGSYSYKATQTANCSLCLHLQEVLEDLPTIHIICIHAIWAYRVSKRGLVWVSVRCGGFHKLKDMHTRGAVKRVCGETSALEQIRSVSTEMSFSTRLTAATLDSLSVAPCVPSYRHAELISVRSGRPPSPSLLKILFKLSNVLNMSSRWKEKQKLRHLEHTH